MNSKIKRVLSIEVVSVHRCYSDLSGYGITMEIKGGGRKTILHVVRLCRMDVPSSGSLNMNESLYLIIGYLLKHEWKDLESKSYDWIDDMRG